MTGPAHKEIVAITVRLQSGDRLYAGWFMVFLGGFVVVAATVGTSGGSVASQALLVLAGVTASLFGLAVSAASSNQSMMTLRPRGIEWREGFAARWFARKPVDFSSVAGVVVYPRRAAVILIRKPSERPPFVFLQPVRQEFPRMVDALQGHLSHVQWIATDMPLIKLLGPPA